MYDYRDGVNRGKNAVCRSQVVLADLSILTSLRILSSLRILGSRYASALPQAAAGTGQSILGPAVPVAQGTIPDQTDLVEETTSSNLAPPIPQGNIPDQNDPVDALAPPTATGSVPDQQDEVSA